MKQAEKQFDTVTVFYTKQILFDTFDTKQSGKVEFKKFLGA